MPTGLRRYHQTGDLHAINVNCFRKRALFDTPEPRDNFLNSSKRPAASIYFTLSAMWSCPHTFICSSPSPQKCATLDGHASAQTALLANTRLEEQVWENRYYDFNVFSSHKLIEKLEYIHMNPVTAGLVNAPADWRWSSYRDSLPGLGRPSHSNHTLNRQIRGSDGPQQHDRAAHPFTVSS